MNFTPKPFSQEEKEMYELCEKLCRTCDNAVIEKYGKKIDNIPFQYCMCFQICGYEIEDGKIANTANRIQLEEYYKRALDVRESMLKDLLEVRNETNFIDEN